MQMFWKRYNKVEKTHRKKAEKHALEQRKIDEGIREAKRQQRKLNFLISQTELFAHFLSKKINQTVEAEQNYNQRKEKILSALTDDFAESTFAIESLGGHGNTDVAKMEAEAIKEQALQTVEEALRLHRDMQQDFKAKGIDGKVMDEIETLSLSQPSIFRGTLKSYQVKGMSWLVNLYQQGISGILADEMGLGKTVQTIAFLGHLAESIGIWGPFLVIAPASTLNNWHQEFTRFLPDFKVLPYWGNPNDRKVLRKFWSQATICTDKEAAPFHVLVTSYQLVISDVRCFQRVKWQFMVLDEAQALKSSSSARWKTLLEFKCRNRLLLTGTPIQNTMAELWALLHFIMPSLFDSHNEFNEWFSKDIENHIENKSTIDQKQLSRLHLILKPFMLRRIKKDVENELSEKIEVRVHCGMTPRQNRLYKALQQNLKLEDLLQTAGNSTSAPGNTTLMNLVMQFRKTCNHPDLFERREVTSPIRVQTGTLQVPSLLFHEGLLFKSNPTRRKLLYYDLNIHSPHNVFELNEQHNSMLSFLNFFDIFYSEYWSIIQNSFIGTMRFLYKSNHIARRQQILRANGFSVKQNHTSLLIIPTHHHGICFVDASRPIYQVSTENTQTFKAIEIPKCFLDLHLPRVVCNPCDVYSIDRNAANYFKECKARSGRFIHDTLLCLFGVESFSKLTECKHNPWFNWKQVNSTVAASHSLFSGPVVSSGISGLKSNWCKINVPSKEYLVSDSGKMFALDFLLKRLKVENHRVLIYSQMTKMIDLLEEYMLYRKHTYIRLDGSSRISERRDMVADFQKRDDIFVFLLSTRAGGLGINLTAADTVIFYDSDWNPTVDQQAMDRAHRLGQTKQVTVYRLVCQGTVDERILQRAEEKNIIQKMVISGGHFKQENLKTKEVVSLLLDDEQMIKKWNANKDEMKKQLYKGKKRGRKSNAEKELEQAKRMRELQRDSLSILEDLSAPTSTEPTPVPSPQSSTSQEPAMDEDSIIVVDDDESSTSSPKVVPRPRRARGRPRIRPIQADSGKKRASRNTGRQRRAAAGRRGRKPVRGRAAEMAGARAGQVAGTAAAYAVYGYEYKDGGFNRDANQT